MTIKLAENGDINDLINIAVTARSPLYSESFKPIFHDYMVKLFNDFKALEKRITFVYCVNLKSVGYLSFTIYPENKEIEIDQLFVIPSFQNNGYGVSLVQACEDMIKKMGIKKIILASEHTALNFYSRMGYSKTGETYKSKLLPNTEYPYLNKHF